MGARMHTAAAAVRVMRAFARQCSPFINYKIELFSVWSDADCLPPIAVNQPVTRSGRLTDGFKKSPKILRAPDVRDPQTTNMRANIM